VTRTGWLGVLALVALVFGAAARLSWPDGHPALDCDPSRVRWVDAGTAVVATCGPEATEAPGAAAAPAGAALALGVKLDLNRATEAELRLVSGIGPKLAHALVEARAARGGAFRGWDEVDDVPGVGPAKLAALKGAAELRVPPPTPPAP